MRALRDFNTPKIISDDMPVFLSLIGDLFPSLNVPRKRSAEFERAIKKTAAELKLQAEDGFVLKVTITTVFNYEPPSFIATTH